MPAPHRSQDRDRAVELYLQKDRTVDEIAEEVGASRSTIYSWLAMAGVTGNRTRSAGPVEHTDLHEQVAEILTNQLRCLDDIERLSSALTALRAEQDSSSSGWMAAINETRRDIEETTRALDALNATLNRLVGAVETLVTMGAQPQPRPR